MRKAIVGKIKFPSINTLGIISRSCTACQISNKSVL